LKHLSFVPFSEILKHRALIYTCQHLIIEGIHGMFNKEKPLAGDAREQKVLALSLAVTTSSRVDIALSVLRATRMWAHVLGDMSYLQLLLGSCEEVRL
jgi:hypothetical protein